MLCSYRNFCFFNKVAEFHVNNSAFCDKKFKFKLIFFFLLANWQLKNSLLFSVCWCSLPCSSTAAGASSHCGALENGGAFPLTPSAPHTQPFLRIPCVRGCRTGGQRVQLQALLYPCLTHRLSAFISTHVHADINGSTQGNWCYLSMGLFPLGMSSQASYLNVRNVTCTLLKCGLFILLFLQTCSHFGGKT